MLIQVVDRVRARLLNKGCPALVSYGIEHLWDNDVPPLVVCFIPTRDRFLPPEVPRPKPGVPFGVATNPKSLALVKAGFDCYLRARGPVLENGALQASQDYEVLFSLQNAVYQALTGIFQAAWTMESGETVNDLAGASKLGQAYRFHGTVDLTYVQAAAWADFIDCTTETWLQTEAARYGITVEMLSPAGDAVIQTQPPIAVP